MPHRESFRPQRPSPPKTDPHASPSSARAAAARVVSRHAGTFPDLSALELDRRALDARDAALAHAITDTAISRWLTLAHLLNAALDRPLASLQAELQSILLTGAAQLIFLDRIPPHAAIDQSVELSKSFVRPGAAPMVNAVLRRVAGMRGDSLPPPTTPPHTPEDMPLDAVPLEDGRWLALQSVALPHDPIERLAVATSHPVDLLRRWRRTLDAPSLLALAMHSLANPPTILNTSFAGAPLPGFLAPHQTPGHSVLNGSREDLIALLRTRNDLWVQDPSSSAAIEHARHLRPRLIVDYCAGQGTKTRQLALTFPNAHIVASDPDPARFRTLRDTFAGHASVKVVPAETLHAEVAARADLILLDVPCSNTGVLARRREAKYRAAEAGNQFDRLLALQRRIVDECLPLLSRSPRGRILYATCSIDPRENRDVAAWACSTHRFRLEHEVERQPQGRPAAPPAAYADGSYSALLA